MIVKRFLTLDEGGDPPMTHFCETLNYMPKKGIVVNAVCGKGVATNRVEQASNMCPACKKIQNEIFNRPIAKGGEGVIAKEDAAFADKE